MGDDFCFAKSQRLPFRICGYGMPYHYIEDLFVVLLFFVCDLDFFC